MSNQPTAFEKGEGSLNASARRKKDETNKPVSLYPRKKGKTVSHAVVETVFGNLRNSVADGEELRRKRQEDAQKCGRVSRTIGNKQTKTAVTDKMGNESDDTTLERSLSCQPACDPTHSHANGESQQLPSGRALCPSYGPFQMVSKHCENVEVQ